MLPNNASPSGRFCNPMIHGARQFADSPTI
jgi:hypothetical protein